MTELSTANSFIVRVYRIDTEDPANITGLVEMLDGSGERVPFTDINELAAVLKRGVGKRKKTKL
ncbi:hypothetical protein [Geotalea uraniireducens]|uniref:Uncharacterized protein n=1 Tax=Geotalea uraniireducens (strain Rf4) TaxID=351605 RepID=A5GAS0_GEOUR|nr:hypothetical protein [Geotalea uraniireducens]ABQ25323.1 hypothetical protein Gura_1118 [Geotalea uraniireducens Rf4]